MVTVFTPTYNRAYILGNLYKSLQNQTTHDFEWIIIDDGSEDGTEELVRSWMHDTGKKFQIIYRKVQNGGKHRAINLGITLAKYEAFFIVDSDDALTEDAIAFIDTEFSKIADQAEFAGISGLKMYKCGEIIGGSPQFSDYVDATNFERKKYLLLGDKAEVYKTSVLKRYPFPEFENETFLMEAVVWDAIAFDGLKLRWFNKPIYYGEYMADGLSRNGYMKIKSNPCGWAEWIRREKLYGRLKGQELSNELFRFIERVDLPKDVVCETLEISEKEYNVYELKKKRITAEFINKVQNHGIKSMALYGYGNNARRLMEYITDMKIEIPYVIDRNYVGISDLPAYSLSMDLPEVDSVCITLKKPEREIKNILEKKLSDSYIWQLMDFMSDEW